MLVAPQHVADAVVAAEQRGARVFEADDPLAALGGLARAWLERLRGAGCRVVGITGSTGKTSTKDILLAMLAPRVPAAACTRAARTSTPRSACR